MLEFICVYVTALWTPWYFFLQSNDFLCGPEATPGFLNWCNHGAHRSVTFDWFVFVILHEMGFVSGTVHLCKAHHEAHLCQRLDYKCRACCDSSRAKDELRQVIISEFMEIAMAVDSIVHMIEAERS